MLISKITGSNTNALWLGSGILIRRYNRDIHFLSVGSLSPSLCFFDKAMR